MVIHDGTGLKMIPFGVRSQVFLAIIAVIMTGFSGYGAAQAAYHVASATGIVERPLSDRQLFSTRRKITLMHQQIADIRHMARVHAARIEQRQALITAALTGEGDEKQLALAALSISPAKSRLGKSVVAPFENVEHRQVALAGSAQALIDKRYAGTAKVVRKLGLRPDKFAAYRHKAAMGGEYVAANNAEAAADLRADTRFRALFQSWKKLDTLQQGVISIPSVHPVTKLQFTSNFGIRTDPFRGTAAMHSGVDIPGPIGTPVYATADGIVSHAGRQGGYGNLVEINHGKGIATRYGHLSKILVGDNEHVKRGQLIALMGSTGRSTGSHLHYEVRIDGHAVNPVPFLTTADYLVASLDRSVGLIPVATGGPAPQD